MRLFSTADHVSAAIRFVWYFLPVALVLTLLAPWNSARAETMVIAGSAENTEVVAALASAYMKGHPGIRIRNNFV